MADLLHCPFCGRIPAMSVLEDDDEMPISAWVACDCGVQIHEHRTEDEAAAHWNKRADHSGSAG